ncbi:Zinc-finger associated domain (zf-AD) [Popillia japonica]|uniref:Zinc-finger associated domain (Zf-AD) n=1 Tax=Popillia japonica TaxID=7064 RepID=A0AAW1KJN6_POPJA
MTDIFGKICRTCLKPAKQFHNIFTHSTNNNLVSYLIMDCTPMRVAVNDGFPTNACSDCVAKLNSIYDFKKMVMESDIKLRQSYRNNFSEANNKCGDHRTDIPLVIKSELNELESVKDNSDVKENISVLCDPVDFNDLSTKHDDTYTECNNDDKAIEFKPVMKEESPIELEMNLENACDTSESHSESTFQELSKDGEIGMGGGKIVKRNISSKNVNEQQVQLLNNADYNRIMSMGLTKKEKNRMTIFCQDCNKSFTFGYFVGVHSHVHTGNLLFKCEKCDKRFPKPARLKNHMKCHVETKDFQCEECSKSFKTIHTLRIHKRKHSNERPYKCHLCTKAFKFSSVLQTHIRKHLNQKPHVCEMCGQSYADPSGLYRHRINTHTADRSKRTVSCDICGKIYAHKSALRTHITRQHAGKRPHVCEQCGKSFFDARILNQHMLIHTGEKPYACRLCGKKFRQKAGITQHMRIHTAETPHP